MDQDPPISTEAIFVLDELTESPVISSTNSTRKNPILSKVLQYGWPTHSVLNPYFTRKLELSNMTDLCNRVFIPPPVHDLILRIAWTKTLACMFAWWPQFNKNRELCSTVFYFPVSAISSTSCSNTAMEVANCPLHLDLAWPFLGHYVYDIDWCSQMVRDSYVVLDYIVCYHIFITLDFCPVWTSTVIVGDNARYFSSAKFQSFLRNNRIEQLLSSVPSFLEWVGRERSADIQERNVEAGNWIPPRSYFTHSFL